MDKNNKSAGKAGRGNKHDNKNKKMGNSVSPQNDGFRYDYDDSSDVRKN
ncbi:hypothetical protein [Bacillus sp. EB01]|nr:hypothetical protein [Bacillus sp. EB01]